MLARFAFADGSANGQGARQRAPYPPPQPPNGQGRPMALPVYPTPPAVKAFPAREQPPLTWDCREGGSQHPRDQ